LEASVRCPLQVSHRLNVLYVFPDFPLPAYDAVPPLVRYLIASQVPILTINVLQALPKTPLWDRLARENHLVNDPHWNPTSSFFDRMTM
jgi:hypothetical protein